MTTATQTAKNLLTQCASCLPQMPTVNLLSMTRRLSIVAIPCFAVLAFSSLPTAEAWFGSNPRAYVACMDACDKIPEDLIKMVCYGTCWIVT